MPHGIQKYELIGRNAPKRYGFTKQRRKWKYQGFLPHLADGERLTIQEARERFLEQVAAFDEECAEIDYLRDWWPAGSPRRHEAPPKWFRQQRNQQYRAKVKQLIAHEKYDEITKPPRDIGWLWW